MKDEIKEILDILKDNTYVPLEDGRDYKLLYKDDDKLLLDYITNLQEKLKVSQTNEETYRLEMLDITECLGLYEDTIFDEVKGKATNLQEEIERLNNIIDELEKWLNEYYESNRKWYNFELSNHDMEYYEEVYRNTEFMIVKFLKQLKELKEGNK